MMDYLDIIKDSHKMVIDSEYHRGLMLQAEYLLYRLEKEPDKNLLEMLYSILDKLGTDINDLCIPFRTHLRNALERLLDRLIMDNKSFIHLLDEKDWERYPLLYEGLNKKRIDLLIEGKDRLKLCRLIGKIGHISIGIRVNIILHLYDTDHIRDIYREVIYDSILFSSIISQSYTCREYRHFFGDLFSCLEPEDIEYILSSENRENFLHAVFEENYKNLPIKNMVLVLGELLPHKDSKKLQCIKELIADGECILDIFYDLVSVDNGIIIKSLPEINFTNDGRHTPEKLKYLALRSRKDAIVEYLSSVDDIEVILDILDDIEDEDIEAIFIEKLKEFNLDEYMQRLQYEIVWRASQILKPDGLYDFILDNAFTKRDIYASFVRRRYLLEYFLIRLDAEDVHTILDSPFRNEFFYSIGTVEKKFPGHLIILYEIDKRHRALLEDDSYRLYMLTGSYLSERKAYEDLLHHTRKGLSNFACKEWDIRSDEPFIRYLTDNRIVPENSIEDILRSDISPEAKLSLLDTEQERGEFLDGLFRNCKQETDVCVSNLCLLLKNSHRSCITGFFLALCAYILGSEDHSDGERYDLCLHFLRYGRYAGLHNYKLRSVLESIKGFVCSISDKKQPGNTVPLKYELLFRIELFKEHGISLDDAVIKIMRSFRSRNIIEILYRKYLLKEFFLRHVDDREYILRQLRYILKKRHWGFIFDEIISALTNEYIPKIQLIKMFIMLDFSLIEDPLISEIDERLNARSRLSQK